MTKRKFSEMEEEQVETIEIDDSCPSPVSQKNGTPLRSIVCVRNREHIKNFEKTEECFILEFDPNDAFDISKISASENTESGYSPDLHVLAEKGQVACRDYPHSRHNCVKYSFEKTPHISYCELLLLVKIGMEHRDIAMHSTMNLGIMKGC
ncbi:uncharacterized protein LOC111367738 isoform X2 [Olea europaea var. sylvestris]|uniref:uncharacterized protein LOC111367738 isoform X2 n=1 Tax=Olea europaea var. sylvestris TaxID=158386 RepID=UPI000C1D0550|nr:uncharacterized protein LOC111367738 isoform X2 [Olea europaea var. sylvestris]